MGSNGHQPRSAPTPPGGADASRNRPATVFVDWAELETRLNPPSTTNGPGRTVGSARRRTIRTVGDQSATVRANVQDSARTVLTWLAAVVDRHGNTDLDRILDRCLRPGPDVTRLNYAALAEQIEQTLGVSLSPKRVRSAVRHLRKAHRKQMQNTQRQSVQRSLDALQQRLEQNYAALIDARADRDAILRREIATEVLAAVRCGAGQLIDQGFGEGIPEQFDLDQLEDRYLDFVRDLARDRRVTRQTPTLADDLHKLLVALGEYDGTAEADMRLVMTGSRVVASLAGPESLPGVMARLNVLVAGRAMLDTEVYVQRMVALADRAEQLHDDPDTRSYMNWVRRLPPDQRVPSPIRVASYCLNNAATHVLTRVFLDELDHPDRWLDLAGHYFERMRSRDSGFQLVRTTQALLLAVEAHRSGDGSAIEQHFKALGPERTLDVLKDLMQYDNCDDLVHAVHDRAVRVLPELKHQLFPL